jgi:hypothetical protein
MISMKCCAKQDAKRLIEKLEKWVTMHQPALNTNEPSSEYVCKQYSS